MRQYFYSLLRHYLALNVLPQNSALELDPTTPLLVAAMPNGKISFRKNVPSLINTEEVFPKESMISVDAIYESNPDYLIMNGLLHYERDIQGLLSTMHDLCHKNTRLILTYYSSLWRPFINLASRLG